MIVKTKKTTLCKTTILHLIIAGFILSVTGCSDGTKKYIGKHTINLPLYTVNYDTTISIREFGNIVHPEMHYYDLYTSTIDIYKVEGSKLTGQFKYVFSDRGKLFSFKPIIKEQTFVLNNFHMVNDTLKFLMEVNPTHGVVFEGCFYQGSSLIVGLPKKLFTWIDKNHCTEGFFKENNDYLFFNADQSENKKELYRCQTDSLKNFIISNPGYIEKYKSTIDYLSNKASN